jgi:arginyl-tRNA synthetase
MNIRAELEKLIQKFVNDSSIRVRVERTPNVKFGHYTTNVALPLAKSRKESPNIVAQQLSDFLLNKKHPAIAETAVAGPGFVNIWLKDEWLEAQVELIARSAQALSKNDVGKGKRVHLEFISANPTGPLTLANARGGFLGDTLAKVFKRLGWKVRTEYYVNDRGNQVGVLAESVLRRYWQQQGITVDYPETCYQGTYIDELARKLQLPNYKLSDAAKMIDIRDKIKDKVVAKMLAEIQRVVTKVMGIHFDDWISEKHLVEQTKTVQEVTKHLEERQAIYQKDGATWLATTKFGDDKDRVLIKADGEMTYFLPDIAYHWLKFTKQKSDLAINILGADHHGYLGRMHAALQALGVKGEFRPIIIQFVRLLRDGKEVKMSKRQGTYIEAEEVIQEVGLDVARFFFLMFAVESHLDFNLDLAKQQNEKNPVYYVQYAHARIASILKKVSGLPKVKKVEPLHESERYLILQLQRWPEVLEDVSNDLAAHRIPQYALELARSFHEFYTQVRVIDKDQVWPTRLQLIRATKNVLADVLDVLGINAPVKM